MEPYSVVVNIWSSEPEDLGRDDVLCVLSVSSLSEARQTERLVDKLLRRRP